MQIKPTTSTSWPSFLLTGLALTLPTTAAAANNPSCSKHSPHLKHWTVKDFDFHASYIFTTPSHQNSWGYVNFTLHNPVLDYQPICSAQSSQLSDFFYGNVIYKCQGGPETDDATFTFSRPDNNLRLNQTWHCPGHERGFEAEGGIKLGLHCEEEDWQNPDWHMGEFYSTRTITCEHVTVKVPIEEVGRED